MCKHKEETPNNRSVMPVDVRGSTRTTMVGSVCKELPVVVGIDICNYVMNVEFLVVGSH